MTTLAKKTDIMKATFNNLSFTDKIAGNRKEKNFTQSLSLVGIDSNNTMRELAVARFYTTNSRSYCCVWIHSGIHTSGGGYAGGYGYHRASAAMQCALDDAGITLNQPIDGRGDGAMEYAMIAIGEALVARGSDIKAMSVIKAHG